MAAVPGFQSDLVHGPINKTDTNRLFGGGGINHKASLITRRPKEMLIQVDSFNPDFLKFQDLYYDRLAELCPDTTDLETGLSTNGVFTTPAKGKCVSGFMANPMGYTPRHNRALRASLGLKVVPTADFVSITEELSSLVHSGWHESDINVTPGSSGGWIGFRKDADWKIAYGKHLFTPSRVALFLQLALLDEIAFANEFETVFAYYSQKREQVDEVGKVRRMWGLNHALDPDRYPDDYVDADKRVTINGVVWPNHSATRARLVNAAPWAINVLIAAVSCGTMKHLFKRWPEVWHTNTPEQIEALINGHYVWHGDAGQFDQSHPVEALDAYHRGVKEWWDPRVVDVAEKLLYAPYYAKPLAMPSDADLPSEHPAWIGKLFSKEREVVCGNRSGHAWTSMYNKVLMVAAILYAIHLCGYKVRGNLDYWLTNKGPIKFVNNGDDTILYAKDKAVLDRCTKYLTDPETAIYKIEREKGGVYNGMPTIIVDKEKLIYKCVQNQFSSVIKILTNERSIYNPKNAQQVARDEKRARENGAKIMRRYWYLGFGDKITNAYKDPVGSVVWSTFLEMWSKHMRGYHSIPEMLDIARRKVPPLGGDYSQADLEVLEDSRKLHYKWLPEEIDPKVLEEVSSRIDYSVFSGFISTSFRGVITPRLH